MLNPNIVTAIPAPKPALPRGALADLPAPAGQPRRICKPNPRIPGAEMASKPRAEKKRMLVTKEGLKTRAYKNEGYGSFYRSPSGLGYPSETLKPSAGNLGPLQGRAWGSA